MEGDQSHNPNNAAVVAAEGQPTPSNESHAKATSTEASGYLEPPYTTIGGWVEEVKYYKESQREYTLMRVGEEDSHSPKFSIPNNSEVLVRALMGVFLSDSII